MLHIPSDLDSWDPRDVTDWIDQVGQAAGAGRVTGTEYAAAQHAVTAALLGEDLAARIHQHRDDIQACPACGADSVYACGLDRYVHDDGSDNRTCWRAITRGESS